MLVSGAAFLHPARQRGFSLLEAVIAAGLVFLTVASVTAAVTSISRAGRRAETVARVDTVLASVSSRLAALPFCAADMPQASATVGPDAGDLLAAMFPNADVGLATDQARFVAVDDGDLVGGSFVTLCAQDGVLVTSVARFRERAGGAWLQRDALVGWDVAVSDRPPAAVLVVELTAAGGGVTRKASLVGVAGAGWTLQSTAAPSVTP